MSPVRTPSLLPIFKGCAQVQQRLNWTVGGHWWTLVGRCAHICAVEQEKDVCLIDRTHLDRNSCDKRPYVHELQHLCQCFPTQLVILLNVESNNSNTAHFRC